MSETNPSIAEGAVDKIGSYADLFNLNNHCVYNGGSL